MIKMSEQCNYCGKTDDVRHFFLYCPKVHKFWEHWANWQNSISKIAIRKPNNLEECILFGLSGNDNLTQVLNYSMIYRKCCIYIQRLLTITIWSSILNTYMARLILCTSNRILTRGQ